AQLNIGTAGSMAAGTSSTISVGGALVNSGRITSSENLTVNAGSVANYGTLGAAQNLNINTSSLLNDRGLIFSGNDMTLSVGNLTNQNGDFYSLGNATIKGYGSAQAGQVLNLSGSMESGKTFTIDAANFANRTSGDDGTQSFALNRTLVSGFIAVQCGDCSGGTYDVNLIAREVFEGGQDNDNTASSLLTAGGDFIFNGGEFLNSKSTLSASGNITINANNMRNVGAVSGSIERTRIFRTGGIDSGSFNVFMPEVVAYNQRNNPDFPNVYYIDGTGNFAQGVVSSATDREKGHDGGTIRVVAIKDSVTDKSVSDLTLSGYGWGATSPQSQYDPNNLVQMPTRLQGFTLTSDTEVARDGSSSTSGRSAVIQAGGNVSITATKDLQNSVIHEDYGSTGGANKVGNTNVGNTGTTVIRISSQLPPDLAQQQVNPLSLPGFSLPTGDNGLFRLSKDGTSDVTQASGWTVGGEHVTTQDHLVKANSGGPRSLLVDSPAFVSTSERAVDPVRHATAVAVGTASTVDVSVKSDQPRTGGFGDDMKGGDSVGNRPVTRVTGLPETRAPANGHKYLIETNPVLTDLKQFMSSDYLLAGLGYDPDQSAKRLGDGLYEQRLVQQAVVARTGQAFIDGQTSNEALFKYLMNNAIASKDQLNLSLGVTLTSQQVAALTHDIVWLEEHEVNGEKVLVPVVYLAQAAGRLGPTGALIAGNDVTLIAGENLDNVGTLKATNNLSATAGKDLVNSGLIQAGNRLDLLATNDIVNKSGGIITGRDVSLTAKNGDVIIERTITSSDSDTRFGTQHHDYADNAARIEAANDLTVKSGRDINVTGGVMQSGGNMTLDAGRDLNVSSVQVTNSVFQDSKHNSSDITQLGADIDAGRDLSADAGRDIKVIASQIDAKRNIAMTATENLIISSAADEEHSLSKSKKLTTQEDHVKQVMSDITASGSIVLNAGQNLTAISSRITAGDEAYLAAGGELQLLAAQDTDYSLYDKKKKGSWGSKKTKRDEITQVTNIGTQIKTGGNLTLFSDGDQRYQGAHLESGKNLTLESGGSILFEAVKDLRKESHEKSNSNMAWYSMSGKGTTDETFMQSVLTAQGELAIKAAGKITIDVKEINQKTVSQAIDAMVTAEPGLAWIKQADMEGKVDWRLVKEIHESWKYDNAGLGAASALIIAIVASMFLGGLAGAMLTNFTVGTVNNGGDIGAGIKATVSEEAIKGYATQWMTGYALNGIDSMVGGWSTDGALILNVGGVANPGYSSTLLNWSTVTENILRSTTHALVVASIGTAINGGSFKEGLVSSLVSEGLDLTAAFGNKQLGDLAKSLNIAPGSAEKILMHAILGGALSAARGGDFKTGALAAAAVEGLNAIATETLGKYLDSRFATDDQFKVGTAQIIGVLAGTITGGDLSSGSWVAGNTERYNQQLHREAAVRLQQGFEILHAEGKFLDLQPQDVLNDLQKIVDGEKDPSKLDPKVVAFLNQFPPAMLRDLFLEPTQTERLIQLGIEIGFPSISGKGNAAVTIGEK
ncbi:MAG: DUF637 domain-containing protein, partial [Pseudomonas sp.]